MPPPHSLERQRGSVLLVLSSVAYLISAASPIMRFQYGQAQSRPRLTASYQEAIHRYHHERFTGPDLPLGVFALSVFGKLFHGSGRTCGDRTRDPRWLTLVASSSSHYGSLKAACPVGMCYTPGRVSGYECVRR
jgi:hypothetical protein